MGNKPVSPLVTAAVIAAVILLIIGFAVFGITTLMHIPPTIEKDTGFIPNLNTVGLLASVYPTVLTILVI